jgi:hypothetical protein
MTAGATLVVACLLTLVVRRRLRNATIFACASMLLAAPWLGWTLALNGLPALDLRSIGNNTMLLAAAPFVLMTGYATLYPGLLTAVVLLIVLVRRRHFVPDLFFGLYCIALVFRPEPPLHAFAAVLPMFLWMLWRVARIGRFAAIARTTALLMVLPALWFCAVRVYPAVTRGAVAPETGAPDDWREMQRLFVYIRGNTPEDAVLLADLDPVFYLYTGRTTVRGFTSVATPDQLVTAIRRDHVSYVVLTPDADLPESASFHRAVAALERGGLLEPVDVPGSTDEYRLLRVR